MYSSTLALLTKTPIERQELQKLKTIVQNTYDHNDSVDFRVPVDWQAFGLLDYPELIKKPMDLGTVQKKLNSGQYLYVEDCIDDIQMIWDNCKIYNLAGSWIYNLADKLEKNFKKMLKNYLSTIPFASAPGKTPTSNEPAPKKGNPKKKQKTAQIFNEEEQQKISYQQKVDFSEKIKILSPEGLGLIVEKIMQTCPTAFSDIDGQRVQILLQNIDLIAFRELQSYAQELQESQGIDGIKKIKIN